jgi:hypothetical protein
MDNKDLQELEAIMNRVMSQAVREVQEFLDSRLPRQPALQVSSTMSTPSTHPIGCPPLHPKEVGDV